jgi:tetratricopeptide (TPR) repeat protein
MRELLRRRVPQSALAFVAAGWGLLQFLQFLEDRYEISPRWVDSLALTWVLLLPAILYLAWAHGAPDRQPWLRRHTAVVAIAFVVSMSAIGLGLREPAAGPLTTTVTVEDENGVAVQRAIATAEYRHVLQLSFPTLNGVPEDERWRGLAFTYLLENDLFQNPFAEVRSPWMADAVIARAGIEDPRQLPRAMVRELAQRNRADFHLVGDFRLEEDEHVVQLELIRSQQGTELARVTLRDTDLFSLADRATVWAREAMGLPRADGADFPDLPIAEVVTQDLQSLRHLVDGLGAFMFDRDFARATASVQRAVEADPTNATAQLTLYSTLLSENRYPEAVAAIDAAMQHAYRLSERMQFLVRAQYYGARNDVAKALAVMEMWRTLRPGDSIVYRLLASNYNVAGRPRASVEAITGLLELMPDDETALQQRADLLIGLGEPAAARRDLERLLELQPDEPRHHLALARSLRDEGSLQLAREHGQRAQLFAPTDLDATLFLAGLDLREGRADQTDAALRAAYATAKTDEDRLSILEERIALARRLGRLDQALRLCASWDTVATRVLPPIQQILHRARWEEIRAESGDTAAARARLDDLRKAAGFPADRLVTVGDALVALRQADPVQARAAVDALDAATTELGVGILRPMVMVLQAEALYLEGAYDAAIAMCDSAISRQADLRRALLVRARSERAVGRLQESIATLEHFLVADPHHPEANLELARSHLADSRPDRARPYLEKVSSVLSGADAIHADRRDAERLLAALDERS